MASSKTIQLDATRLYGFKLVACSEGTPGSKVGVKGARTLPGSKIGGKIGGKIPIN
jgi:hypothetical protein